MSHIKMVLFDLDGTLLPMDQDIFVKAYFKGIAAKLAPHGYVPEELIAAIWAGTNKMIQNDGSRSNEKAFWAHFASLYGARAARDLPLFDAFYRENFDAVQAVCGYTPCAGEAVARFKSMGFRVALATNPIFPAIATEKRIRWAGLTPEDFELYTTYENASYCKPNLDYYREILQKLDMAPEECLMVGNDVGDDMVARKLGMEVFLLTDCLINKIGEDISAYPTGGFPELLEYAAKLQTREDEK